MSNAASSGPKMEPHIRNRIIRFLHVGIEDPKYYPGCWTTHKYFEVTKLPTLRFIDANQTMEAIELIVKVGKSGWCTRFETIAYALVKCLHNTSEDKVREAAYKASIDLCNTSDKFLLFNKYTRLMRTGNGHGWCKSSKTWYLQKDPLDLAKEVTDVRARYGRSHKTILRKSHIKVPDGDNAHDAIIKYVINGLKIAKNLCGAMEGTEEIFDYIQKVEDMRHCEDPAAAAAMATLHQFTLEHVPAHLLTSQDVWDAILPQMSLRDILHNLQRIHNMGFLTIDSTTTAIIISLMNNQDFINKSQVTPIEVYITLNNYKAKTKPLAYVKIKVLNEKETRRRNRQILDTKTGLWEWSTTKRHPTEIKNWGIEKPPNPAIIASLNKLFDQAWLTTKPTKARYLITLDMRHHMFKGRQFCKQYKVPKKERPTKLKRKAIEIVTKPGPAAAAAVPAAGDANNTTAKKKRLIAECFYQSAVTPGHAAIIMALQILKREKNAKLAVFTEEGIELVSLEKNFVNLDEAEFKLRSLNLGRVQQDAPMKWALENKGKFDVFINIIDRATRYLELDYDARGGRGNGGRFGQPPKQTKKGVLLPDHCPVRALELYREKSKIKNAKLIVMNLASHRVQTTDGSHTGVLDIVGIDEHVPKVIDAFVLGQFQ